MNRYIYAIKTEWNLILKSTFIFNKAFLGNVINTGPNY